MAILVNTFSAVLVLPDTDDWFLAWDVHPFPHSPNSTGSYREPAGCVSGIAQQLGMANMELNRSSLSLSSSQPCGEMQTEVHHTAQDGGSVSETSEAGQGASVR